MPKPIQLLHQVGNVAFIHQTCSVSQLSNTAAVYVVSVWWMICWCPVTATLSPLCCLLQGPPLGQRAGQNNQAKDGELPPEWSSPLSGNQRGAGPHNRLLPLKTRNRSDMVFHLLLVIFSAEIFLPVKIMNSNEKSCMSCSLQMILPCPVISQRMRSFSWARGITSSISTGWWGRRTGQCSYVSV